MLNLTTEEARLLENVKTAYEDFSQDFIAKKHPKALRALMNGFDAAATLYASLMGKPITRQHNKRKYVDFLMSATPKNDQTITLFRRDKKQAERFTFADMVYEVRCQMDHAYEDLDSRHPQVDNHVVLSWSWNEFVARPGWTLPMLVHPSDKIAINAYSLIEKLASVVHGFVYVVEIPHQMAAIKKKEESLRIEEIKEFPYTVGRVAPSQPSFFELQKQAGLVRVVNLTPQETEEMLKRFGLKNPSG